MVGISAAGNIHVSFLRSPVSIGWSSGSASEPTSWNDFLKFSFLLKEFHGIIPEFYPFRRHMIIIPWPSAFVYNE